MHLKESRICTKMHQVSFFLYVIAECAEGIIPNTHEHARRLVEKGMRARRGCSFSHQQCPMGCNSLVISVMSLNTIPSSNLCHLFAFADTFHQISYINLHSPLLSRTDHSGAAHILGIRYAPCRAAALAFNAAVSASCLGSCRIAFKTP